MEKFTNKKDANIFGAMFQIVYLFILVLED